MQLRHWLATGLSLGFLLAATGWTLADDATPPPADGAAQAAAPAATADAPAAGPALPRVCVAAGIATQADCDVLIAKDKEAAEAKAAAAKAAADQAAAQKAATDEAAAKAAADKLAAEKAAEQAAAQKAAVEKAAAAKAAAAAATPVESATPAATAADDATAAKAAADKEAAAKAPAAEAAAAGNQPQPGAQQLRVRLSRDCVAAGIKTQPECDAFRLANGKPARGKPPAAAETAPAVAPAAAAPADTAADDAAAAKAATDKEAAAKAAAAEAAAAASDNQPKPQPGAEAGAQQPRVRLSRDCVAAGIKTQPECDAFRLANGRPSPAGEHPAAAATQASDAAPAAQPAASASQPAVVAPATPAGALPAEVTAAKPGEKKPPVAPPPATAALPDITVELRKSVDSYNASVAALGGAGTRDAALANIRTQLGRIDALCKTNQMSTGQCLAQYGVQLSPLPTGQAPAGKPIDVAPVQPVEVIGTLPKGVTQQEVAPLLDSAKDADTGTATPGQQMRPGRQGQGAPQDQTQQGQVQQQPVSTAPPPADDKAAQAAIAKPTQVTPITQTQGQVIDASGNGPKTQLPQNVTVINQTVVNNTTTTTTNNTQNNNGPGAQQNNPSGQPSNGPGRRGNNGNNGNGGFANSGSNGNNGPNRGPGRGPGGPNGPGGDNSNPIGLGLQVILQLGNDLIINSPAQDQRRIADSDHDRTTYEQLPNNRYRETIMRPNGVRIVTVYDRNGDILRRSRFDQNGRETVLAYFDASHDQDLLNWRDPGDDLPPLQLHIPARDYVLDADQADPRQVERFFAQPPVEQVQRLYSIDEVKRSARIRDMVRRLEIGDLTFDSGASTISEDQVGILDNVAQAMLDLLQRNPAETFLIEGHTDAVGSDIANLRLSDARAATVAEILTDFYHIPPENLATQGYGERFLKVETDSAEPLNRRVVIRRITPLVTIAQQAN